MSKKIVFAVHMPTDSVEDGLVFGPGVEGRNSLYRLFQVDAKQLLGIVSRDLTPEDIVACLQFGQIQEVIDSINEDCVHNREQKALDNHVGNMFPVAKIEFHTQVA